MDPNAADCDREKPRRIYSNVDGVEGGRPLELVLRASRNGIGGLSAVRDEVESLWSRAIGGLESRSYCETSAIGSA